MKLSKLEETNIASSRRVEIRIQGLTRDGRDRKTTRAT